MKEKIQLTDTVTDIVFKMSEGNPGAVNVICGMIKDGGKIDPQGFLGGLGAVMLLDTYGVYGSRIYMLCKDVCKGDMVKLFAVIRGVQLGIIPEPTMHRAIDSRGEEGLDVEKLLIDVKKRLADFGRNEVASEQPDSSTKTDVE